MTVAVAPSSALSSELAPWVLVCGGFHRHGGMDRANLALAEALLKQGRDIFLVGHDFDESLTSRVGTGALAYPGQSARVHITRVPRPLGVLMAESSLRREGMRVAAQVKRSFPAARVLVNGGNCPWPDINWAHSVHAAWPRYDAHAPLWFRAKSRVNKQKAQRDELLAWQRAKLIVANSERTRRDLIALGIPEQKIRVIYLGSEPEWKPPTPEERKQARSAFELPADVNVVAFVGGLGYDRNKGFDTLLAAWHRAALANAVLIAAGAGRGFIQWRRQIEKLGLQGRVRLLGFTERVGELLAATDLFVSPVRYEAFGLNVLEALCRGVPSIVSKSAGAAEVYPPEMHQYLLDDSEDVRTLSELLRREIGDSAGDRFDDFGLRLRLYTMRDMAEKIIESV
jgi:glycosyltransferase involved in cell wall biosynthesis